MTETPEETAFYRILVAIETDATRYYGPEARRPRVLDAADAEQLLAHIATDLGQLIPGIPACSLIAAGALFDQVQLMRPGFPAFRALENVPRDRRGAAFKSGLVSIGGRDGVMPSVELQPLDDIPLGLLQLLPLVVQGPASVIAELGQAMEYRFLEEGQLSAHSAAWMQTAFDVVINHARLMTLTDLNAMLRLQLEHFGFLGLWELLDAALNESSEPLTVQGNHGQVFEWRDGAVHTRFESFDYWAREGGGSALPAERQALAEPYADWTREMRQYSTTLATHGLEVQFAAAGNSETLAGTWFSEPAINQAGPMDSAVTEHSFAELGTIAITAVHDGALVHYYPLQPGGLNDVHAYLRGRIPEKHTVAFPGTLLYDEASRSLVPDSFKPPPLH